MASLNLVPTLERVLTGVENALSLRVGRAVVSPGRAPWDNCCEGQLAIWVAGITTNSTRPGCPATYRVNCVLQVIRCQSGLTNNGQPPSARDVTEDGYAQLIDMQEIFTELSCTDYGLRNLSIDQWNSLDSQGNCGGGEWSFSFLVT